MGTRRETCYTIACDVCGNIYAEELDGSGILHFDALTNAILAVTEDGWIYRSGHVTCAPCVQTRNLAQCGQHGHAWSDWHPCGCHGRIPDHAVFGCGLFRYCQRDGCEAMNNVTLADLPTIDEPQR